MFLHHREVLTKHNIELIPFLYLYWCFLIIVHFSYYWMHSLMLSEVKYEDVCMYICHIWSHLHQPSNKENSTHICKISLNKHYHHIPDITHTVNILNEDVCLTVFDIYAKAQVSVVYISYIIAKCVRGKYAHKLGTCAIYLRCIKNLSCTKWFKHNRWQMVSATSLNLALPN